MNKAHISRHISSQFNAELQGLYGHVMNMGELVQEQISNAMTALVTGDVALAERVITSDYRINALEVRVDD